MGATAKARCNSAGVSDTSNIAISHSRPTQGCSAVICMPVTTPDIKVKAVRALGGNVELVGESYQEAQAHAQVRRREAVLCGGAGDTVSRSAMRY